MKRMSKDVSLPDRIEQGVPNIWKGIRTLFNFKQGEAPQEVIGAVPAAYQTILSNQTFDGPEMPVRHPTLGMQGISFNGSQYLCGVQIPQDAVGGPYTSANYILGGAGFLFSSLVIPADSTRVGNSTLALQSIAVNPWQLGGRVAFRTFQYQRYRYNSLRLRLVSTCSVNTTGTLAIGYVKDYGELTATFYGATPQNNFQFVADLVPSIATPSNVAQAQITMNYDGPELYYMGTSLDGGRPLAPTQPATTNWGTAENRQDQQGGFFLSYDTMLSAFFTPTFNMYLDYEIEVYDPRPTDQSVPVSLTETVAVQHMLRFIRGQKNGPNAPPLEVGGPRDDPVLVKLLEKLFLSPDPKTEGLTFAINGAATSTSTSRIAEPIASRPLPGKKISFSVSLDEEKE